MGSETVGTWEASGRVLADEVYACRDVPGFRAAAMDGYACRRAEIEAGAPEVSSTGAAGTWPAPLAPGCASAISTGAPVPEGADWVVQREQVRVTDGRVQLQGEKRGTPNIREMAEDFRAGAMVARAGTVLGPDVVAAAAATGHAVLPVRRWPRMAILTTGSELDPAAGLAAIPDSNGPMIAATLRTLGIPFDAILGVPDNRSSLDKAIGEMGDHDLLISTGGVSAGEHDLVRDALKQAGARIVFHGVAMRPGKPVLFAIMPGGALFFGLPGNPVAALVGLRFFVSAALRQMLDLPQELGSPLVADLAGRANTTLFLRGRHVQLADGTTSIDTGLDQRSHILSSVIEADCWVRISDTAEGFEQRVFEKAPSLSSH